MDSEKNQPSTSGACVRVKGLTGIKLHYLLFFGGQSAMLPFISIMSRQLGITASALGIVYAVLPFVAFLSVPLICNMADRRRAIKLVLMCAIVATGVSYGSISALRPIRKMSLQGELSCYDSVYYFHIDSSSSNGTCLSNSTEGLLHCTLRACYPDGNATHQNDGAGERNNSDTSLSDWLASGGSSVDVYVAILDGQPVVHTAIVEGRYANLNSCGEPMAHRCQAVCSKIPECLAIDNEVVDRNVYRSHQFWVMLTLIVLSWVFASTVMSLADSICYQILESVEGEYGKQRLWGTIGWGVIGSLIGYLYTLNVSEDGVVDYGIGYILMAGMLILDLLILSFLRIRPRKSSTIVNEDKPPNILKTIRVLIRQPATSVFLVEVFLVGFLTGLSWSFGFWYFQDVGANHTVLGLTMAVQCVFGELPFFFFSDRIISRLGHFLCVALAFLAYGARYVLYGFIKEPWVLLAVEVFHGPAYSLFYATMTSYAKKVAPLGAEASVQGIMAGTFENLGSAVAGLVGGFAMDLYGGQITFLFAGCTSAILGSLYITIHVLFLKRKDGFSDRNHRSNSRTMD